MEQKTTAEMLHMWREYIKHEGKQFHNATRLGAIHKTLSCEEVSLPNFSDINIINNAWSVNITYYHVFLSQAVSIIAGYSWKHRLINIYKAIQKFLIMKIKTKGTNYTIP